MLNKQGVIEYVDTYIYDIESHYSIEDDPEAEQELEHDYRKNNFTRVLYIGTSVLAILTTLWHILFIVNPVMFGPPYRASHLILMGSLVYATSLSIRTESKWKRRIYNLFTVAALLAFVGANVFVILDYETMYQRAGLPTQFDMIVSIILILGILEGARRAYGWLFFGLGVGSLAYGMYGEHIPVDFLAHGGTSTERLFTALAVPGLNGVYGTLVDLSATLIVIFIYFGIFLQYLGGAEYFGDFAKRLSGRMRSGPAQVAIFSSGFMGMLSGSAVANAASTGSFTIPLMKKIGYEKNFSASIESVASIGGQITPPIMGSAAFVMAAITGEPYFAIIVAATIPAFMHFYTISMTAHIRAVKEGMDPIPDAEQVSFRSLVSRMYYFLPIGIIIGSLYLGNSPLQAAWDGLQTLIIMFAVYKLVTNRDAVLSAVRTILYSLVKAADDASRLMAPIAILLALISWIIEIFTMTGLLGRLSSDLVYYAGGNEFLLLIFAAVLAIVFGLGLPTTPAYLLVALVAAPALNQVGINLLAAHLFVLYFAVLSAVTPPGAATCLVTSGIAGGRFIPTCIHSMRISLPSYLLPFMWVYYPAIIARGNAAEIAVAVGSVAVMILMIVIFFENFLLCKLHVTERIAALAAAIAIVVPLPELRVVGFGLFVAVIVTQVLRADTFDTGFVGELYGR